MAWEISQREQHLKHINRELQASERRERDKSHALEESLQQVQQMQSQLVQSEKMSALGQLLAGIAHEINNPINFIHGNLKPAHQYVEDLLKLIALYQEQFPQPNAKITHFSDVIDLDFMKQDLPKILASMRVGTERIRNIVVGLRNFSRVDETAAKRADLHEGIDNTLMLLQHRLKPKPDHPQITVVKHYGTLPPVECYPGQLNQVFMNILANAIDALEDIGTMEPGTQGDPPPTQEAAQGEASSLASASSTPTITIETTVLDPAWVQIAIADNAAGIPADVQARLFDPFFTTKPVGKGTGLGLSISYQIVTEKHNGHLRCISAPGEGTTFVIEIPIVQTVSSPDDRVT